MTVGELIELLQNEDHDSLVVMAKDSEGNEYSPLSNADSADYVAENTWSGYLVDEEDNEDDQNESVPAVVLWPTN